MAKSQPDPRGGHIRLYWSLIDSNAWRCLAAVDQRAYIALARQKNASNNGDLSLPHSVAKLQGIRSQTTLAKSLRALIAVGLIAVTRVGGCARGGQRLPTLYRLTDHEVYTMPAKHVEASKATNEWKTVTTLAMGNALIRQAEQRAAAEGKDTLRKLKSPLQSVESTTPENGAVRLKTTPAIGVWTAAPLQEMEQVKNLKMAGKPALAGVSS
ncbi:hypothetical protein [Rhodoferax sp.]|uniref:hypothetical protein n=1 Tax=Rhodoferax sp. TaxID=50421 RepID=UPI00374DA00D